jgi:hypothetical protein
VTPVGDERGVEAGREGVLLNEEMGPNEGIGAESGVAD